MSLAELRIHSKRSPQYLFAERDQDKEYCKYEGGKKMKKITLGVVAITVLKKIS